MHEIRENFRPRKSPLYGIYVGVQVSLELARPLICGHNIQEDLLSKLITSIRP